MTRTFALGVLDALLGAPIAAQQPRPRFEVASVGLFPTGRSR